MRPGTSVWEKERQLRLWGPLAGSDSGGGGGVGGWGGGGGGFLLTQAGGRRPRAGLVYSRTGENSQTQMRADGFMEHSRVIPDAM